MNPKVDFYLEKSIKWQKELSLLREIILEIGLIEELKWGTPCYLNGKSNIVLIHEFKEYCAVLFFKGKLLQDSEGYLIQQTANVQAARQMRFTNIQDVIDRKDILKSYIFEAIEVENLGLKVELKKVEEFTVTEEFQLKLITSVKNCI